MEAFNTQLLQFFDKLLWVSIQSSVLIILIVLVQKVLRERLGIRWHYFLWGLLLIRLAVPWLPESKMSIFNLVPKSIQQGRIIESLSKPQNARNIGFYVYSRSASSQETTDESETASVRFARTLPVLWLIGVLVMVGYVCVKNINLWRTVKRERPITDQEVLFILAGALSVGLSIFLMTITDTEHPPAATTAIGIIASGWSYKIALFVLLSALCLSLARRLLRSRLKDLL